MNDKEEHEIILTEADEAEVQAQLERAWSEKYDVPSEAPGFEGATPQDLARALFRRAQQPVRELHGK